MNQPGDAIVRARNLRKDYGSGEVLVRAVNGIDLDVTRGETVAVMGPSGSASQPCFTCWAGSTGPPPANCGWQAAASTR